MKILFIPEALSFMLLYVKKLNRMIFDNSRLVKQELKILTGQASRGVSSIIELTAEIGRNLQSYWPSNSCFYFTIASEMFFSIVD